MKSSQFSDHLIVFSRYPEPGTTKTRLAKILGHTGAAAVQQKLTEHTLAQVQKIGQSLMVWVSIYFTGGSLEKMQNWLGPGFSYRDQGCGELGKRMAGAFADSFKQGYEKTVLIGTDCPGLQTHHLIMAFEALGHKDLVLGPAADGGYYLIGLSRYEETLFRDIAWGSGSVLTDTVKSAKARNLSLALLDTLHDVDRPEDLKNLDHNPDLQ